MGIRDRLAAHDARIVSVSELLTAITTAESVTPQEVVRALYADKIPTSVPIWMLHFGSNTYRKGGEAAVSYELEFAANGGEAWLSADAESDLQNGKSGFLREELVAALKAAGWNVPSCLDSPPTCRPETSEKDLTRDARMVALEAEAARLRDEVECLRTENAALRDAGRAASATLPAKINGEAFDRLTRAIEAFPRQYPDRTKAIKLDADLRDWLEKNFSCNSREKSVFGTIISEHFKSEGWDIGP